MNKTEKSDLHDCPRKVTSVSLKLELQSTHKLQFSLYYGFFGKFEFHIANFS